MQNKAECIVIGAGAAGLFCAAELAKRGKEVVVLDKGKKIGRKILMSGGGFCNFTNLDVTPRHYLCHNAHFVKSALARFTPWDFIGKVLEYGIPYHEKEAGQLFCDNGASDIVDMLKSECERYGVKFALQQSVEKIDYVAEEENRFCIYSLDKVWHCRHLIVATGGLSMPGLGVSPLGYQIAEQFGISCYAPRASLVPFTWRENDKYFSELAGVALPVRVESENGQQFEKQMLFTHRGLSGPAILQISNYWQPNEKVMIDLLPGENIIDIIQDTRQTSPKIQLKTLLGRYLPNRLVELWFERAIIENRSLADVSKQQMHDLANIIHHWQFLPNGTEGYRTAEVTLGGVDTDAISSKTMECKTVAGLYFIGEVLDVTGWLGGYNFQWAWSSAYACATSI